MRWVWLAALLMAIPLLAPNGRAQKPDVPVPPACSPDVNGALAKRIASEQPGPFLAFFMVCGSAMGDSTVQTSRPPEGPLHVMDLQVQLPGQEKPVVINVFASDPLTGVVDAKAGDTVFAYGVFFPSRGRTQGSIHMVHCSLRPTVYENGWVYIRDKKWPATTCPKNEVPLEPNTAH